MNPSQIDQVRDNFVHVLFEPDRAAALFYDRLFALAPDTRALFGCDMAAQGRALIQTLSTIVTGLSRFDAVVPALRDLAIRHQGYGVERRHYPLVGDALLYMMGEICGPDFDPAAREAWTRAYRMIADAMIAATEPQPC